MSKSWNSKKVKVRTLRVQGVELGNFFLEDFGCFLAFLICYFALDGDTQNYLMGAALCRIAYLGIRRLDDKNKEEDKTEAYAVGADEESEGHPEMARRLLPYESYGGQKCIPGGLRMG